MKEDFIKAVMNPARMRIIQYFIRHGEGVASDIREELSDIPQASLYRHLRLLTKAGLISVVRENRVRGAMEKVYVLKQELPTGTGTEKEDLLHLIQGGLFSIAASFEQYFSGETADPVKDMLCLGTSTLLMTDEEFKVFMERFGELIEAAAANLPGEGRKMRNITFISSPVEDNGANGR